MGEVVFSETLHQGYGQMLAVDRLIYRDKTAHQDLIIFENDLFGRVLALTASCKPPRATSSSTTR